MLIPITLLEEGFSHRNKYENKSIQRKLVAVMQGKIFNSKCLNTNVFINIDVKSNTYELTTFIFKNFFIKLSVFTSADFLSRIWAKDAIITEQIPIIHPIILPPLSFSHLAYNHTC